MNIFHKKSGLTIIELLIVIAIIGTLAAVVAVNLGSARLKARDAQRKNDLDKIRNALELYYNDHRQYPLQQTTGGSWQDASSNYCNISGSNNDWYWLKSVLIDGGYIDKMPQDPINSGKYLYFYKAYPFICSDDHGPALSYTLAAILENQNDPAIGLASVKAPNAAFGASCNNIYANDQNNKVYLLSSGNADDPCY